MTTVTSLIHDHRNRILAALLTAALALVALGQVRTARANIFPLYLPDLQVSSAGFVETQTATYLKFTVKNTGNATSSAFRIYVKDGNGTLVQVFTVSPSLPVGASQTFYHKLPVFTCGGAHTRTVEVDATHVVTEWNENNNTVTQTYIYAPC